MLFLWSLTLAPYSGLKSVFLYVPSGGYLLLSPSELQIETSFPHPVIHTVTNGRKSEGAHDRQITRSLRLHDLALFQLLNH